MDKIGLVSRLVAEKKLDTTQRVDAALEYLLQNIQGPIDALKLEEYCGVGVVVSPEEVEREVELLITKNKDEIVEKRRGARYIYSTNFLRLYCRSSS